MDIKQKYREETGLDVYRNNEFSPKYVKWLENKERIRMSNFNSNALAHWSIKNHWTYNFSDGKWWQLQESHNYIKLTTEELASLCKEKTLK